MKRAKILESARYVPEKIVTNDMLTEFLDTSDEWILSRTGIKNRRIATTENSSDLATKVFEKLMEKSGYKAEDIDIIIIATITPDYQVPSCACVVQKNCGAVNAFAFDISAACTGFVYAMSVAEKFLISGRYKNAVVIGVDVLSKLLDWEDRTTAVLFGDGAGGVLLTLDDRGILGEELFSDGTGMEYLYGGYNPLRNPYVSKDAEKEDEPKFLFMDGRKVYDFATRNVPKNILKLLEKTNTSIDQVKYIVPHQANSKIVSVIARKIKTDLSKFYINIDEYGNTTAASIPIALSELMDKEDLSNEKIILTGFGGGLTWGSILIEM